MKNTNRDTFGNILRDRLEYDRGTLVKVNGMRLTSMDGYQLIAVSRMLGNRLQEMSEERQQRRASPLGPSVLLPVKPETHDDIRDRIAVHGPIYTADFFYQHAQHGLVICFGEVGLIKELKP